MSERASDHECVGVGTPPKFSLKRAILVVSSLRPVTSTPPRSKNLQALRTGTPDVVPVQQAVRPSDDVAVVGAFRLGKHGRRVKQVRACSRGGVRVPDEHAPLPRVRCAQHEVPRCRKGVQARPEDRAEVPRRREAVVCVAELGHHVCGWCDVHRRAALVGVERPPDLAARIGRDVVEQLILLAGQIDRQGMGVV